MVALYNPLCICLKMYLSKKNNHIFLNIHFWHIYKCNTDIVNEFSLKTVVNFIYCWNYVLQLEEFFIIPKWFIVIWNVVVSIIVKLTFNVLYANWEKNYFIALGNNDVPSLGKYRSICISPSNVVHVSKVYLWSIRVDLTVIYL